MASLSLCLLLNPPIQCLIVNAALMDVKQSFSRRRRSRFRLLLETSKTPTGNVEFDQMIKGRFSSAALQAPFRGLAHVIFAAGAQGAESAFLVGSDRVATRRPPPAYCTAPSRLARGLRYIACSGHPTGTKQSEIQKITEGDIQ
ncbi:hypothetical protein [Sulfuritalea sp.]|uniref:hypothetical protein n=1 Tax=Sulfuritalea sp. TaxID=2480090 RepID=UPI00286E1353|nr:hypothetical protein [Sulfuritalea sp.]